MSTMRVDRLFKVIQVSKNRMKDPKSAMISCNDGFRPVSFLLETMEEEAER